jgi:hypothetical protein
MKGLTGKRYFYRLGFRDGFDRFPFMSSRMAGLPFWARTSRGGKQRDIIHMLEEIDIPLCSSQYGLCE